jgi:hypothetical protein
LVGKSRAYFRKANDENYKLTYLIVESSKATVIFFLVPESSFTKGENGLLS